MADPTTNGVPRPDDPDPKPNRAKLKRYTSNPGKGYAPSSGAWYGYASALIDGAPIFTWLDVPRMLRDPQVQFGLRMLRAPFGKTEFDIRANSASVSGFVEHTVKRFWRRVVPKLLLKYFSWGYAAAIFEYSADNRQVRWRSGNVVEPRDANPEVWRTGARAGQFAGFTLTAGQGGPVGLSGGIGDAGSEKILSPHAMWFAGHEELGRLYDRPRIAGAFEPWLEKRGRNGAVHSRRLWYRKCAFSGGTGYYPLGTTDLGTPDVPDVRNNQDIMREVIEKMENGGAAIFPSLFEGDSGKRLWEFEDPKTRSDVGGVLDYPKELDREILIGLGIPPEVIEASEVGSGWSGRMIPAEAYLGSADELSGMLLHNFDDAALRELVRHNYGSRARYEVEAKPLGETLVAKQQGGPAGQLPAGAQIPGGQPGGGAGGPGGGDGGDLAKLFGGHPPGGGAGGANGGNGKTAIPYDGPRGGHWLKDLRTGKLRHRADMAHGFDRKVEGVARHRVWIAFEPTQIKSADNRGTFDPKDARIDLSHEATPGHDSPAGLDQEHAAALYYALLATAEHGQRTGADPEHTQHALDAIADLAAHPDDLGRLLHSADLAHWVPFTTRRQTQGAMNPDTGRRLYGQRAYAALEGHAKRSAREASSSRARELLRQVYFGEAQGPEHFAELADHLPSLTVDQLKSARTYLGQQFPDAKRRDALVSSIVGYAQQEAERRSTTPQDEWGAPPGQAAAAQEQARRDAEQAKRGTAKGVPANPKPGRVYSVPTSELHVDPARFQYKISGIGAKGVTDELKDVTYDPQLAGVIHVWKDPANGQMNVVNGHHRHERADAAGVSHQNVMFIDAKNAEEARAVGAMVNIAEGKGTAVDAAKFFRDTGTGPEDLKKRNVPVKGAIARDGAVLAKLADPLFTKLASGRIESDRALAIAQNLGHDPEGQVKLLDHIEKQEDRTGKDVPARVVAQAAQDYATAPTQTKTENTLFGTTEEEESLFLTKAELKTWVKGQLVRHAADFKAVSSKRRAGTVAGAGNVLNVEANKAEAGKAAGLVEDFDRAARTRGKVADIIDRYTKEYANAGKSKDAVKSRLLAEVRAALTEADGGAEEPADRATAEAAQPADGAAGAAVPKRIEPSELTDAILFKRSGQAMENLQRALGIDDPVMGPAGAERVRAELAKRPGGAVIATLLAVDDGGGVTGYDRNGFANRGMDAFTAAVDGRFTADELADANKWLQTEFGPTKEDRGHVNQYRWLAGVVHTAKPIESDADRKPGWATGEKQLDIFGNAHNIPRPSPKADQQSLIPREVERKDEAEQLQAGMEKMRDAARNADAEASNPEQAGQISADEAPAVTRPTGNEDSRQWWNRLTPDQHKAALSAVDVDELSPRRRRLLPDIPGAKYDKDFQAQSVIDEAFRRARDAGEESAGPPTADHKPAEVQVPDDEPSLAPQPSKPGTPTADPTSEPTSPTAEAIEKAETKDETPRQVATAATKASDPDYEFARASSVPNAGEDLKGSARHKVNAWRGLADAEANGTAEDLVTRDNLLKAEPHGLMASVTPETATAHLAAHLALNAFPANPFAATGYDAYHRAMVRMRENNPDVPEPTTKEALRKQFYDAYTTIKKTAETLAQNGGSPETVLRGISGITESLIKEFRDTRPNRYNVEVPHDRYNPVANALADLHERTRLKSWKYKATDVMNRVNDFVARVRAAYPEETPESAARVAEHVKDVIEGDSFNKTFGTVQSGKKGFTPADAYVKHATRKGGRMIDAATVMAGTKFVMDSLKMRGLQWGNSVTDDERIHHLTKTAEALADLADITGLPDYAISLDGKLGLAIGARGRSNASAHYEPHTKVINLTRKNGVGTLAHEWGHALDHMLGDGEILASGDGTYLSQRTAEGGIKYDDPVQQAMAELRKAMNGSGFNSRLNAALSLAVRNKEISKEKKEYWGSTIERFARMFETYADHKLATMDRENTYLTGMAKDKKGNPHAFWPTSEETAAMAPAFDKLLAAVKEKYFPTSVVDKPSAIEG